MIKSNTILKGAGILALAVLLGFVLGRWILPKETPQEANVPASAPVAAVTKWTCSMHPQILQPEPGDCPICGMDLIPLSEDTETDDGPRTLRMSEASKALAEIQTTAVRRAFPEKTVRLVGTLEYDETRLRSLAARFPARIDELFVNFIGIRVGAGEHLARVYSPDLLAAQEELLSALARDPEGRLAQLAREKLLLWDLQPAQIDAIIEGGEARDQFVLRAPLGGVVVEKGIREGDYVETGQTLFRIADLSRLWLFLEAYESDLPWLRYGQAVSFTIEAIPGETFAGRISFVAPELDRRTRTATIRVNVDNIEGRLKPGMFARGTVKVTVAGGGQVQSPDLAGKWISPMHPEVIKDGPGICDVCGMDLVPAESLGYVTSAKTEAPIVVPSSAVLRTGKRAVVYVLVPNSERPTYEGREIVLGPRAGDQFVVAAGLEPGEEVVTNGAFKIDSALQIQAKPSMMNPADGGLAAGPHQGEAGDETDPHADHDIPLRMDTQTATGIMPSYLDLQAALAGDDLEASKDALKEMMDVTGHSGALPNLIHRMIAAEDLDTIRRPHFERLSNALIASVEEAPDAFNGTLLRMHCPMVYPDRGADWIQSEEPLQNPYFGAMMLQCGEVKGLLNKTAANSEEHADHAH